MVAPDDSIEVNALTLLASPALLDELHINDVSDSDNSFKITLQSLITLYNTLTATMSNKTLTTPIISTISNTGTVTLPTSTDTLVGKATTDTFTNKTFDANGIGNSLSNVDVADLANGTDGELITWDSAGVATTVPVGTAAHVLTSNGAGAEPTFQAPAEPTQALIVAASDETSALTTGTAKITFRMPYAFTLTEVRASVTTAPTGSLMTIDINESGTTILSTKITIDATEKTSTTAIAAPVISDSSLADDAEMTIDIDGVGATIAGAGLKVYLIGTKT